MTNIKLLKIEKEIEANLKETKSANNIQILFLQRELDRLYSEYGRIVFLERKKT